MIVALALALTFQGVSAEFSPAATKDYKGFESAVRSVSFSEDEAKVFGASDSEIIVFDAATGNETARVEVFGPSAVSSRVALRGGIDSFTLVDLPGLSGGKLVKFEELGYPKSDVLGFSALSRDGSGAIVSGVASRSSLIVGARAAPFTHEKFSVTAVAAAPQGKLFTMGSLSGEVRIVDPDGKAVFAVDAKAGAVTALAFSRDGDALAIGTGDGSVKVYRNDPWWVEAAGACGAMVYAVGWSEDGSLIAAASAKSDGGRVNLIDPKNGKTIAKSDFSTGIYSVAFSKKGDRIALGCEDGVIRVKALRR